MTSSTSFHCCIVYHAITVYCEYSYLLSDLRSFIPKVIKVAVRTAASTSSVVRQPTAASASASASASSSKHSSSISVKRKLPTSKSLSTDTVLLSDSSSDDDVDLVSLIPPSRSKSTKAAKVTSSLSTATPLPSSMSVSSSSAAANKRVRMSSSDPVEINDRVQRKAIAAEATLRRIQRMEKVDAEVQQLKRAERAAENAAKKLRKKSDSRLRKMMIEQARGKFSMQEIDVKLDSHLKKVCLCEVRTSAFVRRAFFSRIQC